LSAFIYTPAPRTELKHTHTHTHTPRTHAHICAQSLINKVLTSNIKIYIYIPLLHLFWYWYCYWYCYCCCYGCCCCHSHYNSSAVTYTKHHCFLINYYKQEGFYSFWVQQYLWQLLHNSIW